MAEPWVEGSVPCPYAPCTGWAEPEEDGDVRYYACAECGGETGYTRVAPAEATCQLGLRIAPESAGPVFLGTIGRGPQ
jgi:hypothetical protein